MEMKIKIVVRNPALDICDVYRGDTLLGMFGESSFGGYHVRPAHTGRDADGYKASLPAHYTRTQAIALLTGGGQ
jgi:hypothetical protein